MENHWTRRCECVVVCCAVLCAVCVSAGVCERGRSGESEKAVRVSVCVRVLCDEGGRAGGRAGGREEREKTNR